MFLLRRLWWLIGSAPGALAALHASFGRDDARALAHRYRPVCHFPDRPAVVDEADQRSDAARQRFGFVSARAAALYSRAAIQLSSSPRAFGVVQHLDGDGTMCLFVCDASEDAAPSEDDVVLSDVDGAAAPGGLCSVCVVLFDHGVTHDWSQRFERLSEWHANTYAARRLVVRRRLWCDDLGLAPR